MATMATTFACSSSLTTTTTRLSSHDNKIAPSTSISLSRTTHQFLSPHHSLKLNTPFSRPSSLIVPKVTPIAEPSTVVEPLMPKGQEVFAVVMIGGRQYIVFPGRFLYTQRLKGAKKDDKIILNKVLLVGTKTSAYIGRPLVPDTVVHAVVEEQGLNDKVMVFKYKKKKHYQRRIGHRQPNTRIRIVGITGYQNRPPCAVMPNTIATEIPTEVPTETPTEVPAETPTEIPTEMPTEIPTETPTEIPTDTSTA